MSDPADFTAILAHWEAMQPDAVAITFAGENRTWAELAKRVRRAAAGLRAAGLAPGDRIAVLDLNHPSCLELTLACAQVGTANAVVNPGSRRPRSPTSSTMPRHACCSSGRSSAARSRSCALSSPRSSG